MQGSYTEPMRIGACSIVLALIQNPAPALELVDAPTVMVLKGLSVHEFEVEMQLMTQSLGVSCGSCHARGNFASEANPRKVTARSMLEMTKAINQQFFPDTNRRRGSRGSAGSPASRATRVSLA